MDSMDPKEEHPLNALTEQASEEERKKQIYAQKSLRTLEGDIQEAISERNVSEASMVMAQQSKTPLSNVPAMRPRSSGLNKKVLIASASVVLVLLGVGAAYYLYLKSPLAPSAPAAQTVKTVSSVIPPDSQKVLDLSGLGQEAVKSAVAKALLDVGSGDSSILQIIPAKRTAAGIETVVGSNDFITMSGLPAPDVLSRSLNSKWMVGTYNDNGAPVPFMIFTDNFFQNAYAGMIAWEKTMPDDMATIFGYSGKTDEENGTSSYSSYFSIPGSFKDGVIDNKDVRAFTEQDGTILMLYSFVDNKTIVITTNENALADIINRLEKQTFVR